MSTTWLIVVALATWRITHLLQAEDGPWDVVVRLRRAVGDGVGGQLMDCFYCLSIWVAVPFAWLAGGTATQRLILWPALSGAAIVIERLSVRDGDIRPAPHVEDEEEDRDGMLRR